MIRFAKSDKEHSINQSPIIRWYRANAGGTASVGRHPRRAGPSVGSRGSLGSRTPDRDADRREARLGGVEGRGGGGGAGKWTAVDLQLQAFEVDVDVAPATNSRHAAGGRSDEPWSRSPVTVLLLYL